MQPGQDRYHLLIENLKDGFASHRIITDSSGKPVDYIFLEVNRAFEKMTGLTRDEVVGRRVSAVLPELKNSGFDWIGTYGKVVLTGETATFESYSEPLQRWYEVTAYNDAPGCFSTLFSDITDTKERRQAEVSLEDREARFQKMLSVVPDMISIHDPQMNILYSNWNGFAAVPADKRKLHTKCYQTYRGLEHICPDCQALDVLRFQEPYRAELELPEGIWVDLRILPILDDNGNVEMFVEWLRDITDRKQNEAALRQSEENLAITLNSIGDAVIATDADGLIVRMNPVAEKLCAWPYTEAKGRPLADIFRIVNAETREPVTSPVKQVLQTGKVVGLANHTTLIARDGTEYQIADSAAPIVTAEGLTAGVVLVFHDVSEDYRLRKELKEREAFTTLVMDNLPIGIAVNSVNPAVNFEYVNDNFVKFYRTSREELVESFWDAVYKDAAFRETIKQRVSDDCASGDPARMSWEDIPVVRNDEETFYITAKNIPVPGKPLMISTVWDVTNRKKAEQDLRRREEEFRALAENAPDIVVRFDRGLRHIYVNPALEKEMGISREQFIGKTHIEMGWPNENAKARAAVLQEVFDTAQEKTCYFEYKTPEGWKHYHSRNVPEFAPDGSVETVLAITRDITAIKEMEAALYQERIKTYHMHQRSLPDELPLLPGLTLAAYYRPTETLQGDYYNVIRRHNQLLLYLVDVEAEKDDGVMQSLYVRKTIAEYLQAHADDKPVSPALLLRYLTERYHQDSQVSTVSLCVFIAVFDKQMPAGENESSTPAADNFHPSNLRYASTGFCTPPLIIKGGASDPDEPSLENLYLAMDEGTELTEHALTIIPGTTFIFSTDGLFNQGPDRGSYELRLQEVLRSSAHLPPELINQAVKTEFDELCSNSPLQNDLAFIVAQVPQREQRLRIKVESDFKHIDEAKEKVSTLLEQQLGHEPNLLHFHELLVNAIEHGNKRDGGKTVNVELLLTDRFYKVVITDQGEGFNWRQRINKELDWESKSERGRGIIMTRMMTDYLGYNERGNRAIMINLLE